MKIPSRPQPDISSKATWGLALIIGGFVVYFAYYVILQHAAFETFGYDLANVSQSIWNTLHGRPMAMTTREGLSSRWGGHFEPILLLLIPIYAIFPTPVTLTVLQAVIVAIGAFPIFWIAQDLLRSDWAGVVFAGVYLMLPALQAATTFDFHGVTLAATFLAFALWALLQKRYLAFAMSSLLAMSCKEDMPLLVLMMGLYILLIQRRWKEGSTTIVVSAAWFIIANFVIIPAYSPIQDNIHIVRYSGLGSNLEEVMLSFFEHPLRVLIIAFEPPKLLYWVRLTMPVAFTSLLDPTLLLLSLPSLAINTLSSEPTVYRPDTFHYTAPIVPFIAVSSISGIARLSRWLGRKNENRYIHWRMRLLTVVLGASLGYHTLAGYTPLRLGFQWPSPDTHDTLTKQMLCRIPPQASISAQNSLASHLANRADIYIFPKVKDAEYIALDTQSDFYPIRDRKEFCQEVQQLVAGSSYGVIYSTDGLLLLRRNVPDVVSVSPTLICNDASQ